MSSIEEEKRLNSINYILSSARAVNAMGGNRIVVHTGSCGKISREYALELAIDTIVIEEVIPDHAKNQNTFKALMYLQAAIIIMLHDNHPAAKLEFMYPGSWRSTCGIRTGRGVKRETLKEADVRFANQTYGLNITSDDQADAICIGHAYLHPTSASGGDLNWE